MSTEAQRARNARKRAKLKAHHRAAVRCLTPREPRMFVWEFACRGTKNPFPDEVEDAALDQPFIAPWALEFDYIPCDVVAPEDASILELKTQVRKKVEENLGICRWDLQVKFLNRYPKVECPQ